MKTVQTYLLLAAIIMSLIGASLALFWASGVRIFRQKDSPRIFQNRTLGIRFAYSPNLTLDQKSVPINVTNDPGKRWRIVLTTPHGETLSIQQGQPADWPDCRERLDEKTLKQGINMYYFKETNSRESYCAGGENFIGWYAAASQGDDSWFISLTTSDLGKDNVKRNEEDFLYLIQSFRTI